MPWKGNERPSRDSYFQCSVLSSLSCFSVCMLKWLDSDCRVDHSLLDIEAPFSRPIQNFYLSLLPFLALFFRSISIFQRMVQIPVTPTLPVRPVVAASWGHHGVELG